MAPGRRVVVRRNGIGTLNKTKQSSDRADAVVQDIGIVSVMVLERVFWAHRVVLVVLRRGFGARIQLSKHANSFRLPDLLCGAPLISMVQSTDLWNLDEPFR